MKLKTWIIFHSISGALLSAAIFCVLFLLLLFLLSLIESLFIPGQPLTELIFKPIVLFSICLGLSVGILLGFILSLPTLPLAPFQHSTLEPVVENKNTLPTSYSYVLQKFY